MPVHSPSFPPQPPTRLAGELRHAALQVLQVADPGDKCAATHALVRAWQQGELGLDTQATLSVPHGVTLPGRPAEPRLVDPTAVPTRSPFTVEGRAALLHAVCHIEFNAINLALDAIWRFAGLPEAYYTDWLRVAGEEAGHFELLHGLLQGLGTGWRYGRLEAHDGLWNLCEKTAHDATARMALVPRTMEARGLDATPLIQRKLREVVARQGDSAADAQAICQALDTILRDEVGHVAVGNRWYGWLCTHHGLDPRAHYRQLAREHAAPRLRPPFNTEARRQAGFTEVELADLLTGD